MKTVMGKDMTPGKIYCPSNSFKARDSMLFLRFIPSRDNVDSHVWAHVLYQNGTSWGYIERDEKWVEL